MIKLSEKELSFVCGGMETSKDVVDAINNSCYNEQFLKGLHMFPEKTFEGLEKCLVGKDPEDKEKSYNFAERTGQAAGMAAMAATVIGFWEVTKFVFKKQ